MLFLPALMAGGGALLGGAYALCYSISWIRTPLPKFIECGRCDGTGLITTRATERQYNDVTTSVFTTKVECHVCCGSGKVKQHFEVNPLKPWTHRERRQ